jgi:hypothetical protein
MDRHDDLHSLEERLRLDRPEPRPAFLAEMAARLTEAGERAPRRSKPRLRFGLAVGFAALFAVAFAAMGALGYAGSAARSAFDGTVGNAQKVVKADLRAGGVDRDAATRAAPESASGAAAAQPVARALVGGAKGAAAVRPQALASGFTSPGAEASLFQYPRFVVACVQIGRFGPFTIVIPRFLVPLFQPFIVNFGPCGAADEN